MDQVENFLEHYGVKGMKWGVHRARPSGGSGVTPPTKVRVKQKPGKGLKATGGQNQKAHDDAVRAAIAGQKARKSTTAALSNKELKQLVERMNLEQQYARLQPPSNKKKVAKFVSDVMLNAGKQVATEATKKAIAGQVANALEGAVKIKVNA